jgi:hypothetical protein
VSKPVSNNAVAMANSMTFSRFTLHAAYLETGALIIPHWGEIAAQNRRLAFTAAKTSKLTDQQPLLNGVKLPLELGTTSLSTISFFYFYNTQLPGNY